MPVDPLVRDLKIIRIRRNLTQEELAVQAGLTQQTVSDIERGARAPLLTTVRRIAAVLDVDLNARERP